MQTTSYKLNVTPGGVPLTIHISQYDVGLRQYTFQPYTTVGEFSYVSGATVTLEATKPDGYAVIHECDYNQDGSITYTVQAQLAAKPGRVWSKVVIRDGSDVLGTGAIIWVVDYAGVKDNAIISDSDISALQQWMDDVEDYAEQADGSAQAAASSASLAESAVTSAQAAATQAAGYVDQAVILGGTPLVAATVSAMSNHDRVYVYTGSETGYTAGNWYYWNGSAWASGGIYNSSAVQTDPTLSVSGMAADAAATGELKDELNATIGLKTTDYSFFTADNDNHNYATKRQFYSVVTPANTWINTVKIPVKGTGSSAFINVELWELQSDGTTLSRVKVVNHTPVANSLNEIPVRYFVTKPCYVAIYQSNVQIFNISASGYSFLYDSVNNVDATSLVLANLTTTYDRNFTGGFDYSVISTDFDEAYRLPVKWRQGTMSNGDAYFTMNGCVTDYMIPTAVCDELRALANTHTLSVNYYDYTDGVYSFSNRVQFTGNHIIDKTHDYFVVNIFKSWSVQTLISECDSIIGLYVTLEYPKSIIESGYHNVPHINKNDIWSMAHQGYSADGANHNKKGGYARAASRGFTHGECDVRLTSDGVPVCCHDATFTDSTTSETVTISSKTYAELLTYNYYGGTIASLEEIIAECKQCGLQLEIDQMSTSNITEVTDVVSKMSAWDICIFAIVWMNQYPDSAPLIANGIKAVNPKARFLVCHNDFSNYDTAIAFTKTLENPVFAVGQYNNTNLNALKTIASELAGSARLHIWTVDAIGDIKNALPYINGWTSNAISGNDIFNPSSGFGLNI